MAYIANTQLGGVIDLTTVTKSIGIPGVGQLPSVTTEAQLGEIVAAYDTAANAAATGAGGWGEFILLAVPVSTTITAGLAYSYTPSDFKVVITSGTVSVNSGFPIAWAVNAVTSDASNVQYTWFQIGGRCTALKTAVQALPNVPIYVSATAGRIKVLASAFRAVLGARTANATTVTSTTSTVAIYLARPTVTAGT